MSKNTSVVFPNELVEKMAKRAKQEGLSVSDLIRKAVDNYLLIDPVLMKNARRFGVALGFPAITVISNLATGRFAQLEAKREVWGPTYEVIDEFMTTLDSEAITGQELFDMLKEICVRKEEVIKKEHDARFEHWKDTKPVKE